MKQFRDPIYNSIEIENYAIFIINSPEFQRLRHLRQLGVVYLVYPSANHTRFEHSLGVYHLTKIALDHLNAQLPESLSDRVTKIVKTAALVHDIGHGPFSHLFEQILHKNNIKLDGKQICHESIGCDVFRKMMQRIKMDVGMDDHDIDCVCSLITGQEADDETFKKYFFLNQIVSNSVNGLDTDKMDYLLRDSRSVGLGLTIDPIRILKNQSIFKYPKDSTGKYYLSSSQKTKFDIMQVYHTRYILTKIIYQTSKSIAWDLIILYIFEQAIKFKLIDIPTLYKRDVLPDDRILGYIQYLHQQMDCPYKQLQNKLDVLDYHNTPTVVFETSITHNCELTQNISSDIRAQKIKQFIQDQTELQSNLFEVVISDIKYGVKNQNPLDFLPIHNKQTVFTPTKFAEQYGSKSKLQSQSNSTNENSQYPQTPVRLMPPVSIDNAATQDMLMPNIFKETLLYVFIYTNNLFSQNQLKESIQNFLLSQNLNNNENSIQLLTDNCLEYNDIVPITISPLLTTHNNFPLPEDCKSDDK
ncbi:DGTP triphosphohydrolase [Spironucleus salmonicida]|uniref:HD domain-containing protein n=1 Tax=Spironucleus salmonicida TaxID=348837 RepID=V6LYA2_9EUKA|nr:DGTP triphosphohydrolase [Spironucleus salmonicida]|eukprot:EST45779.1 HD domain-containing protein [Spironucleus salmonicida]